MNRRVNIEFIIDYDDNSHILPKEEFKHIVLNKIKCMFLFDDIESLTMEIDDNNITEGELNATL